MDKRKLRLAPLILALPLFLVVALIDTPKAVAQKAAKKLEQKPAPLPGRPVLSGSDRDPFAVAAKIDAQIDKRLAEAKVPPSPLADDAEFIRRVSLDIRGRIPSMERVVAFLKDTDPNKRAKLIDEFLADPEYGEHFAVIWYHRIVKLTSDNRGAVSGNHLHDWLADSFNKNYGWNRIVTDMLTATGPTSKNPAGTFWLAAVGDEKLGQPEPALATAAASRLFMGVRLECCECHNHPFTKLKQTEFWGMAAFFAQTHATGATKQAIKNGTADPTVLEQTNFKVKKKKDPEAKATPPAPFGSIAIPFGDGKIVKAKYLGGETPELATKNSLRSVFAAWLTDAQNPYFTRAAANILWANFFGRGIVNPIDDMLGEAKNTHPELLVLLAEELAAAQFDQKHLIRCICNSNAYQRTSRPLQENREDDELYSRMPLKVMSADMLFDSLAMALSKRAPGTTTTYPKKKTAGPREEFRSFFHAEADDDAGVVEDYAHGIPQVLRLMNSKQLIDPSGTVAKLMKTSKQPEQVIDGLYLTALSRHPSAAELERARKYVTGDGSLATRYGELLWVLLNTSEFIFNH